MSTTPTGSSSTCNVTSPLFVSPSASDNFHPGDEVKVTWAVQSNYSTSFACSLSLRSLRLPLSLPILNNASVPTYPSTLTYNNTQISYTDPGVSCGFRTVSVSWKVPPDYDVPSDPNFIITAYSYGTENGANFSDSFNSDVFRIVSPINIPSSTPSATPAPSTGLPQGAIIGIAVGGALAVILIGIIAWFLYRRKRHNPNERLNGGSIVGSTTSSRNRRKANGARRKIPTLNEPLPSIRESNSSKTELDAASKIESCYTGTRSEAGGTELFELPGSPPVPPKAVPTTPKVYFELGNGDEAWEMPGDTPGWDYSSRQLEEEERREQPGGLPTPPPRHMTVSPMSDAPGSPGFHVAQCVNRNSVRHSASRRTTSKARIVSVRRSMTFASVSEMSTGNPRSPGLESESSSGMRSPRHQV